MSKCLHRTDTYAHKVKASTFTHSAARQQASDLRGDTNPRNCPKCVAELAHRHHERGERRELRDRVQVILQAQVAVKYNPEYPRAWAVLGKLAAKNNDKQTLADATAKLGALAPDSPELNDLKKLAH